LFFDSSFAIQGDPAAEYRDAAARAAALGAGSTAKHEAAAAGSNAANLRFMVPSGGGFTVAESGNNPRK
jgi:hypothetical protein